MSEVPLRGVVVGLRVGRSHAMAMTRLDEFELAAVCDLDRAAAESLVERTGEVPIYDDYARMLAEQRPEVVAVCTPTALHYEQTIAAIEAGADDCQSGADGHELFCAPEALHEVARALEAKFGEPRSANMIWKPQNLIAVDDEKAETLIKMLEALDDDDDVQQVYANFEVSDSVMEKMSA